MLEGIIILIFFLISIFIIYVFYYFSEEETELIKKEKIEVFESVDENSDKSIFLYSSLIENDDNKITVIFYELPINYVYWSIGFFREECKCIKSINSGNYQTTEKGDVLAILVSKNYTAIEECKKFVKMHHYYSNSYKKLITHHLILDENYYIKFLQFSNGYYREEKMSIFQYFIKIGKNIKINKLKPCEKKICEKNKRKCEPLRYFVKVKDMIMKNNLNHLTNLNKINVNVDVDNKETFFECLINKSDIIDKNLIKSNELYIIAVDHFKTRISLYSNITFLDYNTMNIINIETSGEISNKFNDEKTISVRLIKFEFPYNVDKIIVLENIFCDYVSGNKVDKNIVIPMEIYY